MIKFPLDRNSLRSVLYALNHAEEIYNRSHDGKRNQITYREAMSFVCNHDEDMVEALLCMSSVYDKNIAKKLDVDENTPVSLSFAPPGFCGKTLQDVASKAIVHYQQAIKYVMNFNIEPIKLSEDGELGSTYSFEIPIPKDKRFDRKYKRELEGRIHEAVRQLSEDSVGVVGINWTDEEVKAVSNNKTSS